MDDKKQDKVIDLKSVKQKKKEQLELEHRRKAIAAAIKHAESLGW